MSIWYPSFSYITSITQGVQTVVGFDEAHDFTVGEIVSFRVSQPYGMVELNNQQATVSAVASTTITVDIDSRNYTAFSDEGQFEAIPAICIPAGSGIVPTAIPAQTNLADAFDQIPET